MSNPRRQTALITGASHGIGLDLAHICAQHGHDLILAARSIDRLEVLAAELSAKHRVSAIAIATDLRDPAAPAALFNAIIAQQLQIDLLINNAGIGTADRFDQTDLRTELDMIAVNITALTALTKLCLRPMLTRGYGRIMNVASTAAFQPGPLMAVYYASKAYVLHFSEAIAEEFRHTPVTITALCPGPTHTNFANAANITATRLFTSPLVMRSTDVARVGYDAMMRGDRIAIPGIVNRLVAFSTRLAPRRVVTALSRMTQEHR
jgi:short-subunit dehydrogenase